MWKLLCFGVSMQAFYQRVLHHVFDELGPRGLAPPRQEYRSTAGLGDPSRVVDARSDGCSRLLDTILKPS